MNARVGALGHIPALEMVSCLVVAPLMSCDHSRQYPQALGITPAARLRSHHGHGGEEGVLRPGKQRSLNFDVKEFGVCVVHLSQPREVFVGTAAFQSLHLRDHVRMTEPAVALRLTALRSTAGLRGSRVSGDVCGAGHDHDVIPLCSAPLVVFASRRECLCAMKSCS